MQKRKRMKNRGGGMGKLSSIFANVKNGFTGKGRTA